MTTITETFGGFPVGATTFFDDLAADNSADFWRASRDRFERDVRGPMTALTEAVAPVAGPMRLFRMNRDVRFSADKTPYKLQLGAHATDAAGAIAYLQIDAEGLLIARGYHIMARDQLDRFRDAVADERTGPAILAAFDAVATTGSTVSGGVQPPLTGTPRGYPRDHPRIAWLRWKGAMASRRIADPGLLGSAELVDEVVAMWRDAEPLVDLLGRYVGPTNEPDRFDRPGRRP